MSQYLRRLLLVGLVVFLCACGGEELPMTRDQMFEARMSVPTLYRTEAGREFIAPGNKLGVTVDPETNQLAWATWKCDNPKCPGEGKDGRPYLFIWPNFLAHVQDDGTVGFRQPTSNEDLKKFQEFAEPACPACLELRNRPQESEDERLQYQNWTGKYVLPEAQERIKELDSENEAYLERERQRAGGS